MLATGYDFLEDAVAVADEPRRVRACPWSD
jgi:hypothetical protein